MKKPQIKLYFFILFSAVIFLNCSAGREFDFSLKNTLAVFLVNNENGSHFCIPVQYTGGYQIQDFEFSGGYIFIGDYEILLNKDEVNISVYHLSDSQAADEYHCYIFIEKFLDNGEKKRIKSEYKKGNINSRVWIEYDITIDDELYVGNGMFDEFELYNGAAMDPAFFPENLNFFKDRCL